MSMSFLYYREYYRVSAMLLATKEGLFKELPDDIASDSMEVEVVYRICLASPGGELIIQDFYNQPAMDKDRQKGGPVTIDGEDWFTEPGEGNSVLECVTVFSSWGDEDWESKVKQMHDVAVEKEGL